MQGPSDAVVEESKLKGYLLNPEHEVGRHKAHLFLSLLGIGADDWRFLAGQFMNGLASARELHQVRSDQHGVKYHVVVDVTGKNGRTLPVLTAWEVRAGFPPRLTTAYIAEPGTSSSAEGSPSRVVPSELSGDARWSRLFELAESAGRHAAQTCQPTPVLVSGRWYPQGTFGAAAVVVRDARTDFARWLIKQRRAHVERGRGTVLQAPFAFYDPARAYASAFQDTLRLNGVEAEIVARLD